MNICMWFVEKHNTHVPSRVTSNSNAVSNWIVPTDAKIEAKNFRYWNWEWDCEQSRERPARRCAESENFYGSTLPKSCTVEVNLWWKDNVLWKEKRENQHQDSNPMSNFVNNGIVDDERNERFESKRNDEKSERRWKKKEKPQEKFRIKWMRRTHSHIGTYSPNIYIYSFKWSVYSRYAFIRALTHTPFKVKLRLIQSLSHDITFRGISVRTTVALSPSHSFFLHLLSFNLRTSLDEKEKNQFLEVVSRSRQLSSRACDTQGIGGGADGSSSNGSVDSMRPREFESISHSFRCSTPDVFISLNQNARSHKKEKTSSCRVISLTFPKK